MKLTKSLSEGTAGKEKTISDKTNDILITGCRLFSASFFKNSMVSVKICAIMFLKSFHKKSNEFFIR